MKITAIETIRTEEFENLIWVQVHTDDGITGLGETFFLPQTVEAYLHAYLFMLSGVDRLSDLSDGQFRVTNHDEVIDRIVVFLEGGMVASSTYDICARVGLDG